MRTEVSFASQQPVKIPVGGTDVCALFSCSTWRGLWVCAAAGTARQEAPAPVEELVPTPIPLHPFPTPPHSWPAQMEPSAIRAGSQYK